MVKALTLLSKPPDWFENPDRGCAEVSGVEFFAPDFVEHRKSTFDSRPARRICRHCPFVTECLEWAIDNHQDYGIWGGLDERQRRSIRRCRKGECGVRCTHRYRLRRMK